MNQHRWRDLMSALNLAPSIETFRNLKAAYAETHRYYHTSVHIDDCLAQFDAALSLARDPAAIETAIWFHDAVYDPKMLDNERKSAAWAERFLTESGADPARVDTVRNLIMATSHHEQPRQPDACLLVDIDLAILGSPSEKYKAFETAVRKEYQWVPNIIYRTKRSALLASFLDRDHIYANEFFRVRFEETARVNISAALKTL